MSAFVKRRFFNYVKIPRVKQFAYSRLQFVYIEFEKSHFPEGSLFSTLVSHLHCFSQLWVMNETQINKPWISGRYEMHVRCSRPTSVLNFT